MGIRSGLAVCWVAAVSLLHMSNAHAGGAFAVRQQSAYGQGTSFAGIAAGGSLSSMFWNPATLADVPRGEIEQVASGILGRTDVKLDPQPGLGFSGSDEGNISHDVFVPAGYAAYRLSDRVVLGVGINSPYGLSTEYNDDSILSKTGIAGKSDVFSVNLNPAVSVEVTDWLTLAIGAQV